MAELSDPSEIVRETHAEAARGGEAIREFALGGLTRRLDVIGVPLSTLAA